MKEYTVKVDNNGTKRWYLDGKLHRKDGPAVEGSDGYKEWYLDGKRHREDGPAVEGSDGYKAWYLDGKRHREDGPAVEYGDGYGGGYKEWYLDDEQLTKEEFNNKMSKPSCEGRVVEIDGVKYRLSKVK